MIFVLEKFYESSVLPFQGLDLHADIHQKIAVVFISLRQCPNHENFLISSYFHRLWPSSPINSIMVIGVYHCYQAIEN